MAKIVDITRFQGNMSCRAAYSKPKDKNPANTTPLTAYAESIIKTYSH